MRSNANLRRRARYMQRAGLTFIGHQPTLRRIFEVQARIMLPRPLGCEISSVRIGQRGGLRFVPKGVPDGGPKILYLHGGGFTIGSPRTHAGLTAYLAVASQMEVWSLDYRLAPEHPAPSAWEDARAAFDALTPDFVAGDSAGGTLALHLAIRRDPKAAVLLSPLADQAQLAKGDFSRELLIPRAWTLRVGKALRVTDPTDPELSPLYDDMSRAAPLLIHVGAGEVLEPDAHAVAKAAPAPTLRVWHGVPHVWQMHAGLNEDASTSLKEAAAFFRAHL